MKKIIFVLFILFPLFVAAQNRITLKDGNRFLGYIDKCQDSVLIFKNPITEINSDRVYLSKLVHIEGYIPRTCKKTINKYNANVSFRNDAYTKNEIHNEKRKKKHSKGYMETPIVASNTYSNNSYPNYKTSAGNLMQIAGQRYLIGLGTALTGTIFTIVGAYKDNNTLTYMGGGMIIAGAIISITGHFKLIEAGKAMNKEAITLSASDNGIGLAINF